MNLLFTTVLAASTVKAVGALRAVRTRFALVTHLAIRVLAGRSEVASGIELSPNRKLYVVDEVLEGPRLTRALIWDLVLRAVSAIGLRLCSFPDPGRQSGAVE